MPIRHMHVTQLNEGCRLFIQKIPATKKGGTA